MKRSGFAPRKTPLARFGSLRQAAPKDAPKPQLARSSKPMAAVGARAKRMRQGKVPPSALEQDWMDRAREFGCIVCWLEHGARTPAAIHHILSGGRRMGHLHTLPLCDPGHHQNSPSSSKISRHPYKARFEQAYGTELELLEQLRALLESPP